MSRFVDQQDEHDSPDRHDRVGRPETITQGNSTTTTLTYNDADQLLAEGYVGSGALSGYTVSRGYDTLLRRTNLVAQTTDTMVNLVIAEDPSAAYITATVRGPLASPSYSVSRGSAKDPPGMVNTLTDAVPNIIPGIGGGNAPRLPIPNIPQPNIFGR